MKSRNLILSELKERLENYPVVALLGPRQIGKTTLAKQTKHDHYFDLENPDHALAFDHPEMILNNKKGLIIIDEIQLKHSLFPFLRYWIDSHPEQKFLLLGSASSQLVNQSAESLAGRISYIEVCGFSWNEIELPTQWEQLWKRGAYPRSFLADTDAISIRWRIDYIRTFLERDIPALGIRLPAPTLRRFWLLIAGANAQLLNYAELGRNFSLSDVAVRRYVEVLESALVLRTLQPWHENISKRQVKRPKTYIRDTGLMHALLSINDIHTHHLLGASWESFAIENIINLLCQFHSILTPEKFYFWRSQHKEEVDLFFELNGKRYGFEIKFNPRPTMTRSMAQATQILNLEQLFVFSPTAAPRQLHDKVSIVSFENILDCLKLET